MPHFTCNMLQFDKKSAHLRENPFRNTHFDKIAMHYKQIE